MRAVLGALLLVGFVALGARVHRGVGGDDFFSLACFARDLVAGHPDVPVARYAYFPGGCAFWRLAISATGGELGALQAIWLGVLAANGVLAFAVVRRVAAFGPALVAGLATVALSLKAQGLDATTEPLATLAALLGIVVWSGKLTTPRSVALGVGLGLAVLMKQQGGLVALGFVALLEKKPRVLLVPVVAVATFLGGVLLEGRGLEPLRAGLATVGAYSQEGGFLANVFGSASRPRLLGLVFVAALVSFVVFLRRVFVQGRVDPATRVLGFSSIAALASYVQFMKRDYAHYALLGVPFVAIAVVLLFEKHSRSRRAVLALVAGALVFVAGRTREPPRWRNDPQVALDLHVLGRVVAPGTELVVWPLRHGEVHWLLGTRSRTAPLGYGWGGVAPRDVRFELAQGVLLIKKDKYAPERDEEPERLEVSKLLSEKGFVPFVEEESATLFFKLK